MKLVAGEALVVATDRPILARAISAISAIAGGFTTWFCLRFYNPGGDWGDLALALFAPFLLVFSIAGLWRVLTLPTTICAVDGARRVVELTRRAPLRRRRRRWRFDDIATIHADPRPGHASSWLAMATLRDGRRVLLMPRVEMDREDVDRFVREARRVVALNG